MMKSVLMSLLAVLAVACAARGQTLADVLCSVQERKLAVVQRSQVEASLRNQADPGQQLIAWNGLSGDAFPSNGSVNALGIGTRIALLNQAVAEFSKLAPFYLNLRAADLAGGAKVGALRPYIQEDFQLLPRVAAENFPVVLAAISRQVRQLRVLPWVASLRMRERSYSKHKWEILDNETEEVVVDPESDAIGWQPTTMDVGALDQDTPQWATASANNPYALGVESVTASGTYAITTYHDGPPDGETDYQLQNTTCRQTTRFASNAHMVAAPPGVAQTVTGRVALVAQTEYNSANPSSFNALPDQWKPEDASFHVLTVSAEGGGDAELTANGPGIKATLAWSVLTAYGTDKEISQGEVASTLPAGSLGHVVWLRRTVYPLFVPTFARGLDAVNSSIGTALDNSALAIRPPSGDGQVMLHPLPGLLVGVPLGMGLNGDNSLGWIGISPGYYDFMGAAYNAVDMFAFGTISPAFNSRGGYAVSPVGIRFDYSANLRFVGAAEDFHVVYATARGTDGRGTTFPEGYPTTEELADSGWEQQSVITAWDLPRIRQIVGRDLIADVSTEGHYATTVTIYRRPVDAPPVARTPGQPVSVSELTPIRTLTFENPSNVGDALFFDGPEEVKVTDGDYVYSVVRNSLTAYTGTVTFTAPNHQETILLTTNAQTGARGAEVSLSADGASLGTSVITGDSQWKWWGYRLPGSIVRTTTGATRTHDITIDASPGCRDGYFAKAITSSGANEPETSATWDDDGLPVRAAFGSWSETTDLEGTGSLKVTRKFGEAVWATTWTELLDGGSRIKTYFAPDGGSHSKNGGAVDWFETEFGSGTVGLPGLPHIVRNKDGTGTTFAWTLIADGSGQLVTESGLLSGDSVTRGRRQTGAWNPRGFATSAESAILLGGTLKVAGAAVPEDEFTGWGAPTKWKGDFTGLSTTIAHDGNRSRLASLTTPLGLTTAFSAFDALDRPGEVTANNTTASNTFTGLGVSTDYAGTDIVAETKSVTTRDALGRLTTSNTKWNGVPDNLGLTYGDGTVGVSRDLGPYGAHSASVRRDDGSVSSASGPTLAFGGVTGDGCSVVGDLLVNRTEVLDDEEKPTGTYQEIHTDAWGRVRKVVTPSKSGAPQAETNIVYSNPDSTLQRVITIAPSGHVHIDESDAFDASGAISRSGIDVNFISADTANLGGTDRFTETVTKVEGTNVVTTLKVTENNGLREVLSTEWAPSTGITVTKINGNEETLTTEPDYDNKTITTDSTKGWSNTKTLNNLGLSTDSTLSGTGIPTTELDPVWRADGSLAAMELTIGGESHSAAFNPDGTLASLIVPGKGNVLGGHTIANGVETLIIDGVTRVAKLDGTQATTSGADIIGKTDTLAASGGGYQQTIHPLALGADTATDFNAAGAPTAKTYAAGVGNSNISGESFEYEDELLASITLPRGGAIALEYSDDGAKDITSTTWPTLTSGSPVVFTIPPVAHGFGYDRAGRIDDITDASGSRSLAYQNGRPASELWTAGPLKGYEVIRHRDGTGRDTGFTLKRDGAVIHSAEKAPNDVSDQISALASGTLKVVPQRDGAGRITGFEWGSANSAPFTAAVTQTWQRGVAGRIEAAGSDVSGAPAFDYLIDPQNPSQSFGTRGRRLKCATAGGTWTYQYGTAGQLTSAVHRNAQGQILLGSFSYQFDGIGRRKNYENSNNFADLLNRARDWENSQAKTLRIRTAAGADVHIEIGQQTEDLTNFTGDDTRPIPIPTGGGWVPWRVLATLQDQGEGAGDPAANPFASPDAKSEQSGAVWVPPVNEAFTYDAAGNRESSALWDYGWDGRNQLVRARTKNCTGATPAAKGYDLTFDYDAEGRRYRKHVIEYRNGNRVSEKEITFVWDGWDLIYERHQLPSGLTTLERKYLWGPDIANGDAGGAGGLLLIRESKGNQTQGIYPLYNQPQGIYSLYNQTQDIIPLYDGTGHVIALTNTNKDLLGSYAYGPFGELIHATGPAAQANPWRYATKYLDEETGLYYFGRRYYDPVTGQWTSRELLGEDESLNLYSYCHNDPVNKVDVLGLAEVVTTTPEGNPVAVNDSEIFWMLYDLIAQRGGVSPRSVDFMSLVSGGGQVSMRDAIIVAGLLGGKLQDYSKAWPGRSTSLASSSDLWILPQTAVLDGGRGVTPLDAGSAARMQRSGDVLDLRVMQAAGEATSAYPWGTLSSSEISVALDRGYLSHMRAPICCTGGWTGNSNTPVNWTVMDRTGMDYAIPGNPFATPLDTGAQMLLVFAGESVGAWMSGLARASRASEVVSAGKPVDLMGGAVSRYGGSFINYDLKAIDGIAEPMYRYRSYFSPCSVPSIIANNPRASFLEEVYESLELGGKMTIRGNRSNPFFLDIMNGTAPGLEKYTIPRGAVKIPNPGNYYWNDGVTSVRGQLWEIILQKK